MPKSIDTRVVISGFVWAAIYNGLWAVAWFTLMRQEWQSAFAALGRPLFWTTEVWVVWGVITVPLGIAVMAYADGSSRKRRVALWSGLVLFVAFALGMTIWGLGDGLSLRVLVLDALVNAVALPAASLGGAATLPQQAVPVPIRERAI